MDPHMEPPSEAIWIETVIEREADGRLRPVAGLVRHVDHPWSVTLAETGAAALDAQCRGVANDYLRHLVKTLYGGAGAPLSETEARVLRGLADGAGPLAWLDVAWGTAFDDGPATRGDGTGSYWLLRRGRDGGVVDRTLVLLAARRLHGHRVADVGVRLTLHVQVAGPSARGGSVRIFGATLSRLAATNELDTAESSYGEVLGTLEGDLKAALGLQMVEVLGVRPTGDRLLVRCVGLPLADVGRGALRYAVEVDTGGDVRRITVLSRDRLRSGATRSDVFDRDPASTLGFGPETSMGGERRRFRARPSLPQADDLLQGQPPSSPPTPAACPQAPVRLGPLPDRDDRPVTRAAPRDPALRLHADAASMRQARYRAIEFARRLASLGIDREAWCRQARPSLLLDVRGPITGAAGRDLEAAEIRPLFPGADDDDPRMQLSMVLGSAAPRVRQRLPRLADRTDPGGLDFCPGCAELMGVAADPRWFWHEIGHVVQFASTGELQLPFVHGVGDALAAVDSDPESTLAEPGRDGWRGQTYPWIQIPGRRHDRTPEEGYGWCGRRNRVRLDWDAPRAQHHHGYFEEQMLSSTLFRLYRSLGGDTRSVTGPDTASAWRQRRSAADYVVYLVLRAVSLLGPDSVAPARTPDAFVSALIDADQGGAAWRVRSSRGHPGAGAPAPVDLERDLGRAHKVIRWAFERQGLYATDDPTQVREGSGRPPPIDFYLPDRRACVDDPGGYAPVPWLQDPQARWLAAPDLLSFDDERRIVGVRVGQRGCAIPAGHAGELRIWAMGATPPRTAKAVSWTTVVGPTGFAWKGACGEQTIGVDPCRPDPGCRALLVSVTAPGDRALVWRDAEVARLQTGEQVMQAVACDNNLALVLP